MSGELAMPGVRAPAERPLHILLLCDFESGSASTIIEHIHAFPRFSRNRYYVLRNRGDLPWWLELSRFDGVIVHYSLIACYDSYVSPDTRARIREFAGFKAVFVQDDYRWINDTVDALAYMRIHALFALAGPDIMDQVYAPSRLPGVRRETVLTGYVPEELTKRCVPRFDQRPIDVGYRARKLPAWIGSHTLQKWLIADRFLADAPAYGLRVDISYREEDRIYGEEWIRFVSNCKAVLGTESGASVCDFTGQIQRNVEAHAKRDPAATFETLRDLYFRDVDGKIMMNVISPRCLEAASLRSLMILYEGFYSGALQPWRHYVPLKPDHSNMDDIVRILRTPEEAQAIVDRAYQEVALNPAYTFKYLVERVDRVIAETYAPDELRYGYSEAEFAWRVASNEQDLTRYTTVLPPTEPAPTGAVAPLLRGPGEKPAAAWVAPGPPPHHVALRVSPPLTVDGVHLVWAEPEAGATSGEVEMFRKSRRVRHVHFRTSEPRQYLKIALPRARSIERVCVRFHGYHSGDLMRLRDLRVDGDAHLIERWRQVRERVGTSLRYRVSELWMSFPEPVRKVLKRPLRAAYDRLFSR